MEELLEDPGLDLVQGYSQVMELDRATGAWHYRGNPRESFPNSIATAVFRKRAFDRVGWFDKTLLFGEDTDWFNRARELGLAMKRIEAVTLHVRRHGRNMTHEKTLVELNMIKVLKKSLDRRRAATHLAPHRRAVAAPARHEQLAHLGARQPGQRLNGRQLDRVRLAGVQAIDQLRQLEQGLHRRIEAVALGEGFDDHVEEAARLQLRLREKSRIDTTQSVV